MSFSEVPPGLEDLMRTAARLNSISALMNEASESVPDSVTVADSTESLQLTMLSDGSIEDFVIENDWQDEIDPEDLGDTLTALLGEAQSELLSGFDEALGEMSDDFEDIADEPINLLTDPRVRQIQEDAEELLRRSYDEAVPQEVAIENANAYAERVLALLGDSDFLNGGAAAEYDDSAPVWCERTSGRPTVVHVNAYWAQTQPFVTVQAAIKDELMAEPDSDIESLSDDLVSQGNTIIAQLIGSIRQP